MRKSLISSSLLAAALACSPFAFAATTAPATSASTGAAAKSGHHWHHHRMHHRMHRHGHGMYAFKKLDLTEAQRSSIHQWMRQDFKQARAGRQALRQKREALGKATPGSAEYQNAANALATAAADAARARVLQRADRNARIYNLLTPAQRTKLADLRAQRRARMEKWRASHKLHVDKPASSAPATK